MSTQAAADKISKKSWISEEDALLLKFIEEYGLVGNWGIIADKMGNRTGKQCRERYHNHLKPEIRKDTWSQEEDELLNSCQREMGNQWAKIAKLLHGRSDNAVKNRWHIIHRKKSVTGGAKVARPTVPKLALSLLNRGIVEEDDLLSTYYSHNSHAHEEMDSSNDTSGLSGLDTVLADYCPGSGRRDAHTSAAADSDISDPFDAVLDKAIDLQSRQMESMSFTNFNNTLSSTISELTTASGHGPHFVEENPDQDPDQDSWIDDIMQEDLSARSAFVINCDRFSDAAISFRDMDSLLDELAETPTYGREQGQGNRGGTWEDKDQETDDEDTDAFPEEEEDLLFDDLTDGVSEQSLYSSVAGAVGGMGVSMGPDLFGKTLRLDKYMQFSKLRDFSPRTTPRSPACPTVKRQRHSS